MRTSETLGVKEAFQEALAWRSVRRSQIQLGYQMSCVTDPGSDEYSPSMITNHLSVNRLALAQ
jgi:hypothetical protein